VDKEGVLLGAVALLAALVVYQAMDKADCTARFDLAIRS
jgi:hypothetical protein